MQGGDRQRRRRPGQAPRALACALALVALGAAVLGALQVDSFSPQDAAQTVVSPPLFDGPLESLDPAEEAVLPEAAQEEDLAALQDSARVAVAEESTAVAADDAADDAAEGEADAATGEVTRYRAIEQEAYEPSTVLVMADGRDQAEELARRIRESGLASDVVIEDADVRAGFFRIQTAEGISAGEAADLLLQEDIEAQPNFLYYELGEESAAQAADADAAAQIAVPDAVSGGWLWSRGSTQWALDAIDAQQAWQLQKTNKAVIVAVIDSGCLVTHADLKDNIVGTYNAISGGTSVADPTGHGTHVAGIIAADADNGVGVRGVSYDAGLYIVKVMKKDKSGSYSADSADIIKGYQNIIEQRKKGVAIRVVNMSLGGGRDSSLDADDTALIRKIDLAWRSYGVLTVAAAGNDGQKSAYTCFPCDASEGIIGVINVDSRRKRSSSSNYNVGAQRTKVLSAPGESIQSTSNDGGYETMSGTSMASPCVAGVAALLFAADSSLTPAQVTDLLCSTATDLYTGGFDKYSGYGEVNAYEAVQAAQSGARLTGATSVKKGAKLSLGVKGASGAWTWSSDATSVATVSGSGVVSGVSAGWATITATNGTQTLKRTVGVYSASLSGSSKVAYGSSIKLSLSGTPDGVWKFSSSDKSVATVTQAGKVKGRGLGTCTITATLCANTKVKISKKIKVKARSVSAAKVTGLKASYVYTGKAIRPKPTVKVGGVKLKRGTDYTLSYSSNVKLGVAKVVIKGKGNYTGKVKRTFVIRLKKRRC